MLGPWPRQRLYTTWCGYAQMLGRAVGLGRGHGQPVRALEDALCSYTGAAHAVATPTARTGIYLALRALITPGTRVLMSPYTIADVVNMVLCAGGVPVFCDVERETCNISGDEVERHIDDAIGCVLVTHFYGLACDIERIASLCRARGIPLVEDCAQAIGTKVDGRSVGTFGDAGVFSFGLFKSVTGFLGGAVISNSASVVELIAKGLDGRTGQPSISLLRQAIQAAVMDIATYPPLFRSVIFRLLRYGYVRRASWAAGRFDFDSDAQRFDEIPMWLLHRMTDAQARAILPALDRIDRDSAMRIDAAQKYFVAMSEIPDVRLPPMRADGSHGYQYFAVQYSDRESLVDDAMRNGRDIALSHHRNCADLRCFEALAVDCPNARRIAAELIYLPTYPGYSANQIRKNARTIRNFLESRAAKGAS
jgi:perosamine synthetase